MRSRRAALQREQASAAQKSPGHGRLTGGGWGAERGARAAEHEHHRLRLDDGLFAFDQQYYKHGGKRTLTLRTFFKIVWGSGWGAKKHFSVLSVWGSVYRARRSDPQISKNNTFFKIDLPASDIVDHPSRAQQTTHSHSIPPRSGESLHDTPHASRMGHAHSTFESFCIIC